jgi:hypothetical protein
MILNACSGIEETLVLGCSNPEGLRGMGSEREQFKGFGDVVLHIEMRWGHGGWAWVRVDGVDVDSEWRSHFRGDLKLNNSIYIDETNFVEDKYPQTIRRLGIDRLTGDGPVS